MHGTNGEGANPGQKILPIKATATGPAMAPPAPPRLVSYGRISIQQPSGASAPRHIAARRQQCQHPALVRSSSVTSPRPGRPMREPTPRMTSRSGEARPRGSPSSSGLGPSLASVAVPPLTRHLCPPITGIGPVWCLVRAGCLSHRSSGPRPSVPRPSVQIDRSAAGRLIAA